MKRFTRALFGALLLTLGITAMANAAWIYQPVKWSHPGATSTMTSADFGPARGYLRDTLWIPMAVSKVDTTAEFSLSDAELPPIVGNVGRTATTADSVAGAYVILVADSSVSSTVNWRNTTVAIQVNYGQSSASWQTFYTHTADNTSGSKQLIVPIWAALAAITTDSNVDLTGPLAGFAPRVRLIVTGSTTACAAPSARVFVKKYVTAVQEFDKIH